MTEPKFSISDPTLQVAFSDLLASARLQFLQQALLQTVAQLDVRTLDEEVHAYIPESRLRVLAGRGLRAELAFALPSVLLANPRLLAYYRLVLGFSQKEFYTARTGLSGYQRVEKGLGFTPLQEASLPDLCRDLNRVAALLVIGIRGSLTAEHLDALSLLAFGPQLRGSRNVSLGTAAVAQVMDVIREIIGDRATRVGARLIEFTDSTGRTVEVHIGADPDIAIVSIRGGTGQRTPMLAIEVKGGTDISNAHNRLGEAEKSHLKARAEGYTDLWTIVNVQGLSEAARRRASPTTTAFFDLVDIVTRQGAPYEAFRDRLLQKLRLPE